MINRLHHFGWVIQHFAECGYQLDPYVIPYLARLPKEDLNKLLDLIETKDPDVLVITYEVIKQIMGCTIGFIDGQTSSEVRS
ncbi:hypothetical protein ANME2D_00547 [Candidatus Methanoperedens nitroreducens]|uniref:Uncharacterized protein n=1 Tax=Candidatus Methanoperedens nitratireducens TaxID=1392998 RepID=A0A062VCW3_9EURY|nr:hypothetical protein ANME2D_00547 [Candidatus Methanoperedens nitroreducens]